MPNKTLRPYIAGAICLAVAMPLAAFAAPVQVPCTGTLEVGGSRDLSAGVQVQLFDGSARNAAQVWPANDLAANYPNVPIRGGLFSLTLGGPNTTARDSAVFGVAGRELLPQLTLTPLGGPAQTLSPRQRLLWVPFAVDAGSALLAAELAQLREVTGWYIDAAQTRDGIDDPNLASDGTLLQPVEFPANGLVTSTFPGSAEARALCVNAPPGAGECAAMGTESIGIAFTPPIGARSVSVCAEYRLGGVNMNCAGSGEVMMELEETDLNGPAILTRSSTATMFLNHGPVYITENATLCTTVRVAGGDSAFRLRRTQKISANCGASPSGAQPCSLQRRPLAGDSIPMTREAFTKQPPRSTTALRVRRGFVSS